MKFVILIAVSFLFFHQSEAQTLRCSSKEDISAKITQDVIDIRTTGDIVPNDLEMWYLSTNYMEFDGKFERDIFIEGYLRAPNEYIEVVPVVGYGADFDEKDLVYFCLDMPYDKSGEVVIRFLQSGSLGRRDGAGVTGVIPDFFHRLANGPAAEFRSKKLDVRPVGGVASLLNRLKPFVPFLPDLIQGTINISESLLNTVAQTVVGAQVRKVVFSPEKIDFDIEAGGLFGMNANIWTYEAPIKNDWLLDDPKLTR